MGHLNQREAARLKRKKRIRKKIAGTEERPRLSVFRSARHIYAQIINDIEGTTIVAASDLEEEIKLQIASEMDEKAAKKGRKIHSAETVGKAVAKKAIEKGIQKVVFDRNGFLYHGRVKAVSDGARSAGLEF